MKSPLCLLVLFCFLSAMGFSQEKAKELPLTAEQKKEVLKADLIYKKMLKNFEKNEFAKATPLAIQALKTYRELLGNKHSKTHGVIIDLGKTQAIMPYSEQVQSESYKLNQRINSFSTKF